MSGWDCDTYEARFIQAFICLPLDKYKNPNLETGNRIIMPPSALGVLQFHRISLPYFFKIESFDSDKTSHCGVLEFGAEEGVVYMPRWMMGNVGVGEGDRVVLREAAVERGRWMRLRPHEAAFLELSDLRAVMERELRWIGCLSVGDTVVVGGFGLDVVDLGGAEVVSLVDLDCAVEFAPSLDRVAEEVVEEKVEEESGFRDFTGREVRLDGEAVAVVEEKIGGKIEEEEEGFRDFTGREVRLDGEAVAVVKEKNGGKIGEEEVEEERGFRAFTGRAVRLDGEAVPVVRGKNGGKIGEEVEEERGFRAFTGRAVRLNGEAVAVEEKNDGGKIWEEEIEEVVREFRAFSGVGRRLDGNAGGWAGEAVKKAVEKKVEKDGGKEEFRAFSGRGRVLGGTFFDN